MNERKIYFVLGSFKLGGTERTASRLGLELLRRGYDVKFILLNGVFDYNEPALIENSIVLSDPKQKSKIVRLLLSLFMLRKILKRDKPYYLVSFSVGMNLFAFFTFYRQLIFRIEANIFIYKRRLYRRYLQKLMSIAPNVKKIVVPSQGLYESCRQYFLAPEKLVMISNPIDVESIRELGRQGIDDYPYLEEGKFIVSAGRLHYSKGFAQLISVFLESALAAEYKLIILGEGPERPALEALIAAKKVSDRVYLLGYQDNPYRFFARARFFILNSAHESFGNVFIESMVFGTPVVSNDCDFGPRHIIKQGKNGVLYDRDDAAAFKASIERVGLNDEFRDSLKTGALEEINHYNIVEITDFWTRKIVNFKT